MRRIWLDGLGQGLPREDIELGSLRFFTARGNRDYAGGMRVRSRLDIGAEAPAAAWGLVATVGVVAAATLVVYPLKSVAPVVSLGVVYIPGVLLVSTFWGWRLGLVAAVGSALAFNWFHLPPVGELGIGADRDVVALIVFVIVALACGSLGEMARARAAEAERRREEGSGCLGDCGS